MRKLIRLEKQNTQLWKGYLEENSETKLPHALEFMEIVKRSYKNCEDYYFFIESKKVEAIFPFFLVKSKLFGDRFISLPFLDVGGFHGKYKIEDIKKIIKKLKKDVKGVKYVEVRINNSYKNFKDIKDILLKTNFKEKESKQQFIIKLKSEEDMWRKFHKHTRNDIRKAQKSGLTIKKLVNEDELKKFYKLYSIEMKNFGSPQHSFNFFRNMLKLMGENFMGFNCYKDKKVIGSLIMLNYNKSGYIAFNVSKTEYRNFRPNDLLYWEAIKKGIKNNLRYIDVGQVDKNSSDSRAVGIYKFKRKWLGNLYDRIYFYYSFDKFSKDEGEKKSNLKRLRNVWRKFPLFITKILGPKVTSQLGV